MDNKDLIYKLECIRESLQIFEKTLSDEPSYTHAQTAHNIKKHVLNLIIEMEE